MINQKLINAPNYKLNLNFLKLVAIISMTIDHATKIIWQSNNCFGTEVGRIAMPLFVFLIAYNFNYNSKNPQKYLARILAFACLSQLPFYYAFGHTILLNILFSLGILGLILILTGELLKKNSWYYYLVILGIVIFYGIIRYFEVPLYHEYGVAGLILGVSIFTFLKFQTLEFGIFIIASLFFLNPAVNSFLGIILYLPLIFLLSLKIKSPFTIFQKNKYIFYAYYPVHLCLLKILSYFA